jgi:hypothetical protein
MITLFEYIVKIFLNNFNISIEKNRKKMTENTNEEEKEFFGKVLYTFLYFLNNFKANIFFIFYYWSALVFSFGDNMIRAVIAFFFVFQIYQVFILQIIRSSWFLIKYIMIYKFGSQNRKNPLRIIKENIKRLLLRIKGKVSDFIEIIERDEKLSS